MTPEQRERARRLIRQLAAVCERKAHPYRRMRNGYVAGAEANAAALRAVLEMLEAEDT